MTQSRFDSTDLPALAPRTHCVLIPRDPNSIYAYWDYTEEDINRLRHQLKFDGGNANARLILRVNRNHAWDTEVGFSAKSRYIQVGEDNTDYSVELGFKGEDDHFIPLTRSNNVRTPPNTASKRDDLIWQDIKLHKESRPYLKLKKRSHKTRQSISLEIYPLTPLEMRDYYGTLSLENIVKGKLKDGGWEKVHPLAVNTYLIQRVHPGASRQMLGQNESARTWLGGSEAKGNIQAGASEGRLNKRQFFFEIWTELLVYGRTESDAKVLLNGDNVVLNPDGTFSVRYALPDGEIPLKFIAQSSDGVEERHIYTRVEREKTIGFPRMLKDPNG